MKNNAHIDDELLSKKEALNEGISAALNSHKKTIKITIRDKLREFNTEIIRFRNSGISYKVIREVIKNKLGLNVSEQTLREHCQQELGFQKRGVHIAIDQAIGPKNTATVEQLNQQQTTKYTGQKNKSSQSIKAEQINEQTQSLINKIEDY